MKILNVVYSLGKGGTERAAQNFAFGYAEIGCDSRVIYTRLDGPRKKYLEDRKIPVYTLHHYEDLQTIKDWNPDVVHLHSHGILPKEFEIIEKITKRAKYIETNVFSEPSPWANKIHISYQLSEWCLWLFKARSSGNYPSEIIPYPVDTTSFARASDNNRCKFREKNNIKKNDIVIGRVGQNYKGKWSIELVEVFEKIRKFDTRIKLLVVNPPDSICERIALSVYKADIVHIDQIQGDENLAICYSSIDIFVLIAQMGESFGMVLAESLLCETPVVTLATPWGDNSQGEVIGNNLGGYVAINKIELVPLIKKLIGDMALRKKMGKDGRKHIIQRYDLKTVASNSLKMIENDYKESKRKTPYDLMMDGFGEINFLSRFILKREEMFFLLFYTLGYQSIIKIPSRLMLSLKRRLLNKFNETYR